jgi:hypothetical protein
VGPRVGLDAVVKRKTLKVIYVTKLGRSYQTVLTFNVSSRKYLHARSLRQNIGTVSGCKRCEGVP